MPRCQGATVYIGNLDERVDERLLYEIMIQAGPLVEIHMPRDRETRRHKAYAFAEYKTQESAAYALGLFSGLVSLYNRSVRFAMSGQEKHTNLCEDAKSSPGQFGYASYHGGPTGMSSPGDVSLFSPSRHAVVPTAGNGELSEHQFLGSSMSEYYGP